MQSPIIHFGRAICGEIDQANRREWFLANGLGAYACGTISSCLTRRYHGLLIAPVNKVLDRHLLLSKADATLWIDNEPVPLFSNLWRENHVTPKGHINIESFYLDGLLPVWIFSIRGIRLEYRIWMEQGVHATCVAIKVLENDQDKPLSLTWDMILNYRDHHSQMPHKGFKVNLEQASKQQLLVHFNDQKPLSFYFPQGNFNKSLSWINNFFLSQEQQRGLNCYDNQLKIGQLRVDLEKDNQWYGFRCALDTHSTITLANSLKSIRSYQYDLISKAHSSLPKQSNNPFIDTLALRADSFIFKRSIQNKKGESIIAGFPWFSDWGRDTMIALPGLTLATGKINTAHNILLSYAQYIDQGMLPNVFPESGNKTKYNTVDAALWYIMACYQTYRTKPDIDFLKQLFPALENIIKHYQNGTRYSIFMDDDSLISAGEAGVQLTWMDAKVGNWVVTPRYGKPIEINALWYNALEILSWFATQLGHTKLQQHYTEMAEKTFKSLQKFWHHDRLYDCIDGPDGSDASIRPNQLFAISLPWLSISKEQAKQVLSVIKSHLLTSYGLRSLAPKDSAYRAQYQGGVYERDGAYHQGTVWSWLLGHFAIANYRLYGDREKALVYLQPIADHLSDAGLGSVSEIFDGDAPHKPRGTPSQAWSIACVLEACWLIEQGYYHDQ